MRLWKKIILVILILVVVILGSGYLYLFQLGGIENIINSHISALVEGKFPLEVTIGRVKGNFFSDLVVKNVTVVYTDSSYHYRILFIPELNFAYSLSNLWNKRYLFDFIAVDSAEITLIQDSTGQYILPDFSVEAATGESKKALPVVTIDDLKINKAVINLIHREDTLVFRDIMFDASVRTELETYAVNIKRLTFESNREGLRMVSAGGKVTYSGQNLVFQDLAFTSADTRARMTGIVGIKDRTGHVEFELDNIRLDYLSDIAGPALKGKADITGSITFDNTALMGTVDIGGELFFARFDNLFVDFYFSNQRLVFDTLYGTIFSNCAVDGKGEIDFGSKPETYFLDARIKNFHLEKMLSNGLPSDLNGHIVLNGRSFHSADLVLDIETDLYESSFDDYSFHTARGALSVTTDSISFAGPFVVTYHENKFLVFGNINYTDEIDLNVTALLDNLDRYRDKIFLEQPGGRGYAEIYLSGETRDPDMYGFFASDSVWLYGFYADSLYADIHIGQFLYGHQGEINLDFYRGGVWDIPYDSGYARLVLDSNLLFIDTSIIQNQFARLSAHGVLDHVIYPQKMTLDKLKLSLFEQQFVNRGDINFEVDSNGFDFKQASIGNEEALLTAAGRVNYDETMALGISVTRLPVKPWQSLFNVKSPLGGYLSCDVQLEGTFMNPIFRLQGAVDSLTYFDEKNTGEVIPLGDLSYLVNFRDSLVTIDSFLVMSEVGRYFARGYFNANLAFTGAEVERLPDLPFDIDITASDTIFDLVSVFMPSVEYLGGEFKADFKLSGTPGEPHLDGGAYLKNGHLKYFDITDSIYTDLASVTMQDNRIVIEGIEAYMRNRRKGGRKSYAYIDGEIVVKSLDNFYYDLDVAFPREFPFKYELDDIEGIVEGDIRIEGETPPLVTGNLTLVSARYEVNFAESDEGSPLMMALSGENQWDLNLNIDILSNFWIKNDDIDAEFSGSINLVREKGAYRFIGEMEILRGRAFLFDKTFNIQTGSQVIFEDIAYPNPRLDIIATTRVPGVRFQENEDQTPEQIELSIHVTGTLEEPELNPAEGSEFNREDILPLIVMNYYSSDSTQAKGAIEERMTQLFASQVSQIGARRLGIETFEIDPVFHNGDLSNTRVTLGFYTFQNLYVYGRSRLDIVRGQEVGFEYRFNKNLIFEGRKDEDELYHLDLKLHWEFK